MSSADPVITATLERILETECAPSVVEAAAGGAWPAPLWSALEETGLTLAWVEEALGGAGAGVEDGFAIVRTASRFAAPVPLAETLLAGRALAEAGLACPNGAMAVAVAGLHGEAEDDGKGRISGVFARVPFVGQADHVVTVLPAGAGARIGLVDLGRVRVLEDAGLGGEPHGRVELSAVSLSASGVAEDVDVNALIRLGAVLRAQQIAGALEHVLERTVAYAQERRQFGRAIAKFQAVQHNLAQLAGEAAAAVAAADAAAAAVARYDPGDERALFAAAAAKVRCGEAASNGAAIAHQVHGAMGYAAEYPLHHYTKRLWTWRDDFGSETEWAERLGALAARSGADGFWPALARV